MTAATHALPTAHAVAAVREHRLAAVAAALGMLRARLLASEGGGTADLAGYLCALRDAEHKAAPGVAGVALYADLRSVRVRTETAALIGFAFAELLRNALTHAFPPGGTGHVGVHLWPVSGLPGISACLLVADDGRGFGDEPSAVSERGIPLARHLVERCGGTLAREPGRRGTVWRIAVPEPPHEEMAAASASGFARRDTSPGAAPAAPPLPRSSTMYFPPTRARSAMNHLTDAA